MSSNSERAAPGQKAWSSLSRRIDDLATTLVLGDSDGAKWAASLSDIRDDAVAAGWTDVARVASESIEAICSAPDAQFQARAFSTNITRIRVAIAAADRNATQAKTRNDEEHPTSELGYKPSQAFATDQTNYNPLEDPELMREFILESREHLARVDTQLLTIEKDPENAGAINAVLRGFHTIKGGAGFLDLPDVRDVAHETESVLDLARTGRMRITPAVIDVILGASDFLKSAIERVEAKLAGGEPGPSQTTANLLERIRRAASNEPANVAPQIEPVVKEPRPTEPTDGLTAPLLPKELLQKEPADQDSARQGRGQASSVKVDTSKLDYLVDMAGEMVIAQSMVRHHPELSSLRNPALLRGLSQLARITSELQKTAMSMRMVPVGGLFQKMARLVRDLARKSGKQIEMETIGSETELDRNMVEELADPLMHMIRNAVDHGLEPPDERRAAGKDPTGRTRLRAAHEAGHIVIEVADDGRGLSKEKILAKARQRGLTADDADLSERDIFAFIFHPGFSTAAQLTDVSGRGIGMDVVKKQIQKLRGKIDIESTPGKGTAFFLRVPLTLAMIDGLVVGVGEDRYILPIFSVREILKPTAEMIFTVENRQELALVREHLLPVVRLCRRFAVKPRSEQPDESLLIVCEGGGKTFCLMVDELIGKQEVVIKSLGETLKDTPGIAGGAILGDGRVGLIVDLEGILRMRTACS